MVTGTSLELDLTGLNVRDLTFYAEWEGPVTVGTVAFETADRAGYAGLWHSLGSKVGAADSQQQAQFAGVFNVVRARVTMVVVGGALTVKVKAK